jgi:ABC-type bacteriocin/lantibiotic exporter with double-glycine peptidase domain
MVSVSGPFRSLPLVFGVALLAAPAALDIPYVRQTGAGCGWASIAMVMQYWVKHQPGLDPLAAAAERIEKDLQASRNGLSGKQLKTYFDTHGFTAYVFTGDLGDLEQHTGKGRPVIVCLGVKGTGAPLHYAVVAGLTQNSILLNDPARGKLYQEDIETFSRAWKATDYWALLAVPKPVQ